MSEDGELLPAEAARRFWAALLEEFGVVRLPARQAEAVYLTVVHGLTRDEVATAMVVTLHTVDAHLHHAAMRCGVSERELRVRLGRAYWRAVGRDEAYAELAAADALLGAALPN